MKNFKIELIEVNSLYGIKEGDDIIVPVVYKNIESAVEEWEWFEIDNSKRDKHRKYLLINRTIEEIKLIKTKLLKYK